MDAFRRIFEKLYYYKIIKGGREMQIEELKHKINKDMILELMEYFGILPIRENEEYIIFPACCHNSHSP